MKIVKPSAVLMEHNCTPYEFIEKVGRTCYKSEDKITKGSAEKFVEGLVKREHMAMLEHETLYFVVSKGFMYDFLFDMKMVNEPLKYFNVTTEHKSGVNIISGSFRSFYDLFKKGYYSDSLDILKEILQINYPIVFGRKDTNNYSYMKSSWDCALYSREFFIKTFQNRSEILFKHLTHTFLFVCDRGVSHEFVRHRPSSFAQESTRYCNYSKDKFGNEITVIEPCYLDKEGRAYKDWYHSCEFAEVHYFSMLTYGCTPQEARGVLPTSLKTELIVTATEEEWQHIVNLRYVGTTGAPHPQIKEVMSFARKELVLETSNRVVYED